MNFNEFVNEVKDNIKLFLPNIISAGMANPFCDWLGSENDSTDLCGCQRNPWVHIHVVDYSDCILLP